MRFNGSPYGASYSGMFGPRTVGASLQPQPFPASSGLIVGPAGDFIGRGRPDGTGMTFSPSPWQYPSAGGPSPTYPQTAYGAVPVRPIVPQSQINQANRGVAPAAAVRESTPAGTSGRDQWLRQPTGSTPTGSASTGAAATGSAVSATPAALVFRPASIVVPSSLPLRQMPPPLP